MTRKKLFEWMRSLGIAQAEVGYSGGGDEGDIDYIEYTSAGSEAVQVPPDSTTALMEEFMQRPVANYGYDGDDINGRLVYDATDESVKEFCSCMVWSEEEESEVENTYDDAEDGELHA